jgi:hypothetical protein
LKGIETITASLEGATDSFLLFTWKVKEPTQDEDFSGSEGGFTVILVAVLLAFEGPSSDLWVHGKGFLASP